MARVVRPDDVSVVLVVFGGLPGTGKTSVARRVADELAATFLRVDSVEVAIERAGLSLGRTPAGYAVAHAVAADQLRSARPVVVDAVNPVHEARAGWESLAAEHTVPLRFVHVVLTDRDEHRRRVTTRTADLTGHRLPTWESVVAESHDPWTEPHLQLDNRGRLESAVTTVLDWLAGTGISPGSGRIV